jgi:SecD/SecF fusion protein
MSGIILLVGALAVGGRGLNLGIDFTSGTRIVVGVQNSANEAQLRSVLSANGAPDATVQRLNHPANTFQISAKLLQPDKVNRVKSALGARFGGVSAFDSKSVGPTFGKTVANSAVIAIIVSLLVISAYVALRFEWKFAIPVLIALAHDLLITSGVYSLTGREVTTATVAALLTILGYSLYDTIIVFDRVRENIPRMPRAAFSQIVNRSMSEVLTRSLATTSCTLMPIIALLAFGGATLRDFAFALLIGVASGAYSSIFIASPVLTHWKEREPQYRARRRRIETDLGAVPAYPGTAADVEPESKARRRAGRLTAPEPETVSAAEFEQMKRDLEIERELPTHSTSTLTKRLSHTAESEPAKPRRAQRKPAGDGAAKPRPERKPAGDGAAKPRPGREPDGARQAAAEQVPPAPAPDIAENEGMAQQQQKPKRSSKSRRRHGRRR